MINNNIEELIKNKALELGYESCGIIKVADMEGYAERLRENSELFPELKTIYSQRFYPYAFPQQSHEWAKSIVICISRYGKYKLPANNSGHIGKIYWFTMFDNNSKQNINRDLFEAYLTDLGLKTFYNSFPGTTCYRWAAQKAGLGVIRKNNFFYTKDGSWVTMSTWLIDKELELIDTSDLKPCPDNCTKCQDACKTGALAKPYATNMKKCMSYILCLAGELPPEELRDKTGKWLYGCDDCQDACPMNKNCWSETEDFPNLNEIAEYMSYEKILTADYNTLEKIIMPKFFYIQKENLWQWKVNAIIAMSNNFEPKYEKYLKDSCNDDHEKIREIANWACVKLGII